MNGSKLRSGFQVIQYLCADYNATSRQTAEGVASLADGLQDHGLTKGEILQICNLAPTLPVELYCVRIFSLSSPPLSSVILERVELASAGYH